jgi:hypothetical protein
MRTRNEARFWPMKWRQGARPMCEGRMANASQHEGRSKSNFGQYAITPADIENECLAAHFVICVWAHLGESRLTICRWICNSRMYGRFTSLAVVQCHGPTRTDTRSVKISLSNKWIPGFPEVLWGIRAEATYERFRDRERPSLYSA